jgi:Domain of unknown function (DUF4157)
MSEQVLTQTKAQAVQVKTVAGGVLQRQCACGQHTGGGECAECRQKREGMLQRAAVSSAPMNSVPPIVYEVLNSPGQPLDAGTRTFMESGFSHDLSWVRLHASPPGRTYTKLTVNEPGDQYEQEADRMAHAVIHLPASEFANGKISAQQFPSRQNFGQVRIHADDQAAESARAINARAYTMGNNIVFGEGAYVPGTMEGRRLLAHELTHVVQQNISQSFHSVQRELIYGSGYPRPFKTDEEEIRSANAHKWSPSSVDFQATATNSGGGSGTDTFQSLLSQIASKPANSISNLGLIGHANSSMFGLSGTIIPGDVVFKPEGVISAEAIAKNTASIVKVRDRFTTSAKITLYGCDAGLGKGLLDALSNAFKVCVRGFTNEISWCFTFAGKMIYAGSRGHVFVETAGLIAPNLPNCDDFLKDIKQLQPDNESCVGVSATPNPKGAAVEAPDDNALAGLEEADSGRASEEAAQVGQGDSTEQANEGVSSENVA